MASMISDESVDNEQLIISTFLQDIVQSLASQNNWWNFPGVRPTPVGAALTSLEPLAGGRTDRETRYCRFLASPPVRLALALAIRATPSGSPSDPVDIRALIRKMHRANPFWGAQRVHGELQKLGIEIAETTVAKYLGRRPSSPSPTWRTFLRTHLSQCASMDFFTSPQRPSGSRSSSSSSHMTAAASSI